MIISIWNHDSISNNQRFDNGKVLTTLLAACGAFGGLCRVAMLENSMSSCMLGDMMFGDSYSMQLNEDKGRCYNKSREESLAEFFKNRYRKRSRLNNIVEIVEHGIYYIPQYIEIDEAAFERSFNQKMDDYFDQAERVADYTLVSTARDCVRSSNEIIQNADIIIVLLPLDEKAYERFMMERAAIADNCILLSMAPENSDFRICKRIMNRYRIAKERFYVLRYNDEFILNRDSGRLLDYVSGHIPFFNDRGKTCTFIKDLYGFSEKLFNHKYQGLYLRSLAMNSLLRKRHNDLFI